MVMTDRFRQRSGPADNQWQVLNTTWCRLVGERFFAASISNMRRNAEVPNCRVPDRACSGPSGDALIEAEMDDAALHDRLVG